MSRRDPGNEGRSRPVALRQTAGSGENALRFAHCGSQHARQDWAKSAIQTKKPRNLAVKYPLAFTGESVYDPPTKGEGLGYLDAQDSRRTYFYCGTANRVRSGRVQNDGDNCGRKDGDHRKAPPTCHGHGFAGSSGRVVDLPHPGADRAPQIEQERPRIAARSLENGGSAQQLAEVLDRRRSRSLQTFDRELGSS